MKRFTIMIYAFIAMVLLSAPACAGVLDTVKNWIGNAGIGTAATVLAAVFGITGFAKRAKWLSGIALVIGTIFALIAGALEAIAGGCNYIGITLQDGKIDSDELKQAPGVGKQLWKSLMETLEGIRLSWASINK